MSCPDGETVRRGLSLAAVGAAGVVVGMCFAGPDDDAGGKALVDALRALQGKMLVCVC